MSRMTRVAATGVFAVGLAMAPTAAIASTASGHCDAYSQKCVQGLTVHRHPTLPTQTSQSSLPFTGADIAALSLAGLVAIGGGSLFVVAGRRRRVSA
jgi:LPXTG-motif cell wall-anchored protein